MPAKQAKYVEYNDEWLEKDILIAHALGGIGEKTYTNSYEAFLHNYEKGHRLFEVDLILTSDGILFARHDWNLTDEELALLDLPPSYINGEPITYEQAKMICKEFTPLTFDEICNLMKEFEDIYIITDTKTSSSTGVRNTFDYISNAVERIDQNLLERIIVQVYNRRMYNQIVDNYKFVSILYTLYQSPDGPKQVIDFVEKSGVRIITMPVERILSDPSFVSELNDLGCFVFAHTVNDLDTWDILSKLGVHGIYTDFLSHDDFL